MTDEAIEDTQVILQEKRDGVLIITLNRPEVRNSINLALTGALLDAYEALASDPELSVGVITGAGKGFSAGMDLAAFVAGENVWEGDGDDRCLRRVITKPPRKPLIAAIDGFGVAGGLEIALSCDLLVAGRSAKMGIPEASRSLVAAGGALRTMPLRTGLGPAMRLALTGDLIDGQRAYEIGLVDEICDDGSALESAVALARKIAKNGPLALTATKQVIYGSIDWTEDEFWSRQKEICDPVFASEDATEGATAFKEKREPVWQGR